LASCSYLRMPAAAIFQNSLALLVTHASLTGLLGVLLSSALRAGLVPLVPSSWLLHPQANKMPMQAANSQTTFPDCVFITTLALLGHCAHWRLRRSPGGRLPQKPPSGESFMRCPGLSAPVPRARLHGWLGRIGAAVAIPVTCR